MWEKWRRAERAPLRFQRESPLRVSKRVSPRLLQTFDCLSDSDRTIANILANDDDRRGRHLSYQRSRHITHPGTSLIKIEGVDSTAAAKYVYPKNRECRNDGGRERRILTFSKQLLPRQEGCLRLPWPEGDPRHQDPRDLGQGYPTTR